MSPAARIVSVSFANGLFLYFLSIIAYIGDEDNMEVRIIAGATVAVVVVLVVVIIMTVLFLRRCVVFVYILAVVSLDVKLLTK